MSSTQAAMPPPAIGDTVFIYNSNRRVYAKDEKGNQYGQPLYRQQWVTKTITSETRFSFILDDGTKIKKSTPPESVCLTRQALEDKIWLQAYLFDIERAVGRVRDVNTLKQIAKLAGLDLPDVAP